MLESRFSNLKMEINREEKAGARLKSKFSGTGVALITPFKKDKSIDFPALENIINFTIENGVDLLVTLGATGEAATLSFEEKHEIIRFTVRTAANRVPIVVGIGGNSTSDVIQLIRQFDMNGVDGILTVVPYYNKPSQEGIYRHYKAIGEISPLPIITYNVPGRTGTNMTAETTLRIAKECKNIVAVKEASGNFSQIMQILKNRPDDFLVLSGDDSITLPLLALGADGVISVAVQAAPKMFCQMVRQALQGKMQAALNNHYQLLDIMEAIFLDGSPAGIKAALYCLGLCSNELRLPLTPVNEKVELFIKKLVTLN